MTDNAMKTIIAGSRTILEMARVELAIAQSGFIISEVVCGEATGVDTLGKVWAREHGIPVKSFWADWYKHGRAAGPIRNEEMGDYADALVAVWDNKSTGTKHMIQYMKKLNKPVYVLNITHKNLFAEANFFDTWSE